MERESPGPSHSIQWGTITSINVSWGGVPKSRVTGVKVARSGLYGDDQNDKIHHGGPDRAVCLYSLERIRTLQTEGHPIKPGSAGENLTIEGLRWESVMPGVRLKVGESVVLEITSFTNPCHKISRSFVDGRFIRISQKVHPGWSRVYARVISEGDIRIGDRLEVLPGWMHLEEAPPRTVPLLNSRTEPLLPGEPALEPGF